MSAIWHEVYRLESIVNDQLLGKMHLFARVISVVFHPIFMVGYMLLIMLFANPYSFGYVSMNRNVVIISILALSVLFPLVSIALMKGVGLIDSIHLRTAKERIAPLTATSIFYLWLYVNIKDNSGIAPMFSSYVLGAILALFIALFLNAFSKISLHTIGVTGILTASILFVYKHSYSHVHAEVYGSIVSIDMYVIPIVLALLAGMVASARLVLKSHTLKEVTGGALVGVLSQILAYNYFIT